MAAAVLLAGAALAAGSAAVAAPRKNAAAAALAEVRQRLPEDEIIYLVLPDRFANGDPANDRGRLSGDRMATGFDPASKAFYHGGDLKGLIGRLDYIQGLGATALWLTPVFANKPVQGAHGTENAGYHGYWGTDFTTIDPHFGTRADYKALVEAAHARGMKVYFDIVVNHTADVIRYRECPQSACAYRSKADFPWTRRGGPQGEAINPGFQGDAPPFQTPSNFAKLARSDYAYTPYVPEAERHAKKPEWLNEVALYHNRGESIFRGESSQYGDFAGLDDVFTEHPRVVAGMIALYGQWIDDFGLDGFRIDTARHVNSEFWQAFVPAMLARARARGIPNFHIFGEVMEFQPGELARHTRVDGLPAVNDFALQEALVQTLGKGGPTSVLAQVFRGDALYVRGEASARQLVTLTGNHDVLRFARAVMLANPDMPRGEVLQRVRLAHAVILTARGVPALYYGDEQGFSGLGNGQGAADQDSREDMFPTQTATYRDAPRLGPQRDAGGDHFDPGHPLYRDLAALTRIRRGDVALRRGRQVTRAAGDGPGLFAFSRIGGGHETLAVFNTGTTAIDARVIVEPGSRRWTSVSGHCGTLADAPGSYRVQVPPLGFLICRSTPD
ncbi:MAG: alpha-amylase [Novosphingobium sp.]|nr:alpha-amylase [Novosphingobium sp.]